jgi:hypothetical protein
LDNLQIYDDTNYVFPRLQMPDWSPVPNKKKCVKSKSNQIVIICSKHENHAKPGEEILPQKQKVARLLDLIHQ